MGLQVQRRARNFLCIYFWWTRVATVEGVKLTRPYLLISSACLLNGAAWFLPVVAGILGGEIEPMRGWQTFLIACGVAWNGWIDSWYGALLAALSVLTTLFFIASLWVVLCGSRAFRRACAWVAAAAFVFNAHWCVPLGPNGWISNLGIGYFLWWWSFVLLAIGLYDLARVNNAIKPAHSQAVLLPQQPR